MGRQIKTLQSNFVAGEFDPLLRGRTDTKQYYQCADKARNVIVIPQGGARRRPGLQYMATLATGTIPAVRFITFEFSTTQRYIMLVTGTNLAVYKDGVKQADVTIPHTANQLRELSWTQSLDTLLLFHPDVQTQKLVRGGSHSSWTLSAVTFSNIPTYQFERDTVGTGTPAAKTGSGISFTSSSGSEFTSADVGKVIRGNGGIAKITAYTSGTTVTIDIKTDFLDTSGMAAGTWTIEEAVWSSARGWPSVGTFHQGRLWVGHTRQRPQSLWASRSGFYFDFDALKTLDDYGFEVTADSDTVSAICALYSGRHLQIFTSDSEWYVPIGADTITPKNIFLKRATKRGAKTKDADGTARRLLVAEADGGVLFVQAGGKAVREFLWDDAQQDYMCQPISLLSSHLLSDPVDFNIRKASSTEEADFVISVNSDGTLALLCTLRDQNITAWSHCSTEGSFRAVGIDGDWMYFAVERNIDGTAVLYLERFNSAHYMDASTRVTAGLPATTITGFSHLNGEVCKVRADDANRVDATPAGGSITLDYEAAESVEVGLAFPTTTVDGVAKPTPYIRTQRVEPNLPDGTAVGKLKRIVEATLLLHQTQNVCVNEEEAIFENFEEMTFDAAPPIYTGNYTIEGILEYTEEGWIEIYQNNPGPMTLLGISMKVAI